MTERNIELSRRKILAGLGTVGVAGAGAGLGTSALFSDEESFEGNVLTAGTLDLIVGYHSYWDQGMAGSGSVSGDVNGGTVSGELSDVKPGDNGLLAFCPQIDDNPAYLWLCGELTANDENGLTEPEADVDSTGGDSGEGAGELADAIDVTLSYCELSDEIGEAFDPEDVVASTEFWSGSFAEFLGSIENGVPLEGGNGDGVTDGFPAPGEQACFDGTGAEETDNPCLCLDWEVPTDVGNEIQSDSIEFDLTFHAEQCRHNDGTTNPCCACGPAEVALELADGTTTCVPVWEGDESVNEFYDFGGGSPFASRNPDIQTRDTTNLIVYEDGDGDRSLVVVHDIWNGVADEPDTTGGVVSADFSGLEPAYSWQVRDDNTGNDSYSPIDAANESVDWQWSANMTDGGAIGPLSTDFDVGVDLELTSGIGTVQYLTPDDDAVVLADDLADGDEVGTRLHTCDDSG